MSDQPEELRYRDSVGRLHVDQFIVGNDLDLPRDPGGLSVRHVETESQQRLVQKYVPRGAGGDDPRHERLDREIRALTRLAQVFGPYAPDEIVRLFGYNTDVEEPYVLLEDYRGQPAPMAVRHFTPQDRHQFQAGLARALQHTAAAHVVHGAVRLDRLLWDGNRVQLTDFESAERAGEPRRAGGTFPARSREQVAGSGTAHPNDDVWGAGLVMRETVLGPHRGPGEPDLSNDPERIRVLLGGVFAARAEERPSAETLLQRLRVHSQVDTAPDLEESLREGRQQFEIASARKRGEEPPTVSRSVGGAPGGTRHAAPEQPTAPRDPSAPATSRRPLVALLVVVLVIAVVLTVVMISQVAS